MAISCKFRPGLVWLRSSRYKELTSVKCSSDAIIQRGLTTTPQPSIPLKHTHLGLYSWMSIANKVTNNVNATRENGLRQFSSRRRLPAGLTPEPKRGSNLRLMDFPEVVWPSVIYTIKNWILARVVIKPYMDHSFTLDDFAAGAKQAMLYMSSLLTQGNFESMEGLVTEDALKEIKKNYASLSVEQRHLFVIKEVDLYFSFPYQVGIMLEDNAGVAQKRFVEITMCFHCLSDSEEIRKRDPTLTELYKVKDKLVICNTRFIKEFTKGAESDWTINIINYFRPAG